MNPTLTKVETYEIKIYLEEYGGMLAGHIRNFQQQSDYFCPVRIGHIDYVCGDIRSNGREIKIFNHPKYPKTKQDILDWSLQLAAYLLDTVKQDKLFLIEGGNTYMVEA